MSRYQNNFKFYQRVQTHQFTEPRRLVQNTIGSLLSMRISNQIPISLSVGVTVTIDVSVA